MASAQPGQLPPSEYSDYGPQRAPPAALVQYHFLTTSPPDVSSNTRILVVCGISNKPNTGTGEGMASPREDGWFYSDMFLYHYLLTGLGANQIYMAPVSIEELVDQYGQYLHGNPYEERKVVLDRAMVEAKMFHGPHRPAFLVFKPLELRTAFLKQLSAEAQAARLNRHKLLVIMLGHGDFTSTGVFIGDGNPDTAALVTPEHFATALGAQDIEVTIMSQACFSGGWTICPDVLNITAMAAAHRDNVSESWPESKSTGRFCGSIFSSALITASDRRQSEEASYLEYTCSVIDVLKYETDGRGDHGICFSSQDDNWGLEYKARVGIPLDQFRKRWEELRGVPPCYGDQIFNRDASRKDRQTNAYKPHNNDHPDLLEYDQQNAMYDRYNQYDMSLSADPLPGMSGSMRGRFGAGAGSNALAQFRRHVQQAVWTYRSCFPGVENCSSNSQLAAASRKLQEPGPMTFSMLRSIMLHVEYRMSLMEQANRYARFVGCTEVERCQKVDMSSWRQQNRDKREPYSYAFEEILKAGIFGRPTPEQGRDFTKPVEYLASRLAVKSKAEIDGAIASLIIFQKHSLSEMQAIVENSPRVQAKKRKWLSVRDALVGV
ncbi:hypothetical protein LZ554_002995 [Drepanopeziza brunnea f. sp. 'monogermtubi']|nr:hypothetical protein LZ554_002995 [Drepanopeziza brunnea f. sp. 'monogermtubi']